MRATILLAAALAAPAAAADWQDIKDPNELRALYSGKTFRGNGWVGHYRADGTGVLIVQGSRPVGRTWAVKGSDQVCVTPATGAVQCFTFKYVSSDRKQVLVTSVSSGGSLLFTVEDGVPNF
jgi:hypothetical protein